MRRRNLEELAIYKLERAVDSIPFWDIRSLFIEKTSDIVYLILNNKIYGIICLGDLLHRMRNGIVPIMKNFTKMEGFQDDVARELFAARNNIQKIPVINGAGEELLGDYSRWDDTREPWIRWVIGQNVVWNKLKKYIKENHYQRVYLIKPVREKAWIEKEIISLFLSKKVVIDQIKKGQLIKSVCATEKNLIIATDEDEWRGALCIEAIDYKNIDSNFDLFGFSRFYEEVDRFDKQERMNHYSIVSEGGYAESCFEELRKKGVSILTFYNNVYHMSDYIKRVARKQLDDSKEFHLEQGEFWPADTEVGKKFFADLLDNEDYISGVAQREILQGHQRHKEGIKDYKSNYYNVVSGRRKTCYQPKTYQKTIYMFGLCLIMGAYLEDQYTIASQLQKKLCENGECFRVENCGSYRNIFEVMQETVFYEGDIIIVWTGENTYQGIDSVELRSIFEDHNVPVEWCLGTFTHINHKMSKIIADTFYKQIEGKLKSICGETKKKNKEIRFRVQNYRDIFGKYIYTTYIDKYFSGIKESDVRGCIVVELNLEPALYKDILENICSEVDELLVFIPRKIVGTKYNFEEYISEFIGFTQENIKVVSGDGKIPYLNFFGSYYSEGDIIPEQAELDAKFFSQCIAKPLNIKYRFGFQGKFFDSRINQYSNILKKELPKYGIKYIELSKE